MTYAPCVEEAIHRGWITVLAPRRQRGPGRPRDPEKARRRILACQRRCMKRLRAERRAQQTKQMIEAGLPLWSRLPGVLALRRRRQYRKLWMRQRRNR